MPGFTLVVCHLHGEAGAMDNEKGGGGEAKRSEGIKGRTWAQSSVFTDDLLLFAEVQEDRLLCLKEGLDLFCRCSG